MIKDFLEKIEEELNEEQRRAVCYDKGPSLVIAGAGSGKTRVLTYKIAICWNKDINHGISWH